ncbi:hypothetical protein HYS99_01915, partial [Candidatus Giovannonibacteria bacterium]|nr:hypothetical protein [Candidatus Giovannonibacteria bacterium]
DASIHSTSSGQAPLSTDTSGWKTYRNEKYGFEFQYPSKNFEINEYDNYATLTDSLTKYEKRPFEIQFSRGVLSQGVYSKISNLKDLIQSYRSSPERFGVKEINIAGFSGVESNFIYDHTEINFIINNYIYSIVWTPSDYEIWRSVIRAFTPINL